MKKIKFTRHAEEKFKILKRHGIFFDKKLIINAIKNPNNILTGSKNRLIAQKNINEKHILRVIYEETSDEIVVITFYPARRNRYAN